MNHEPSFSEIRKKWHGTLNAYIIGFIVSLLLTAASFSLAWLKPFSNRVLIYAVVGLGLAQAIIQLIYFLHLGREEKPRWETMIFYFMIMVLLIIVIGSMWIMFDLDNRLMTDMMDTSSKGH